MRAGEGRNFAEVERSCDDQDERLVGTGLRVKGVTEAEAPRLSGSNTSATPLRALTGADDHRSGTVLLGSLV
jgi:hypothetical protein